MTTRAAFLRMLCAGALANPARALAAEESGPATPDDRAAINFVVQIESLALAVYKHGATLELDAGAAALAGAGVGVQTSHLRVLRVLERQRDINPDRPRRWTFNAARRRDWLTLVARVEDAAVHAHATAIALMNQPEGFSPALLPLLADHAVQAASAYVLLGADPVIASFDDAAKRSDLQRVLDDPEAP
jgi:hypothetical protein